MHPVLSVVVPVYNEEEVLPLLVDRLRPVLDGTGETYEVVAVDDGSKDSSAVVMQRIRRQWPQFRIVRLRANAGHQAAISAGLARAHGDYMVTIDADLQDPPEVIAEMLTKAQSEHLDVVYGVRNDRSTDTAFKRGTAQAFYSTQRRFTKTDAPANAGDFRLMSRATVDAVNALPEHHRVLRLVVPQLGFPSGEVYYRRDERAAGESKYPLTKMVALSIDSLTSGSMAPLRLATWFGLIGFIGAVVIFLYALISALAGHAVAGWTSTVMAVAAVGGVQLVCVGILGEYVGRMYAMMQGRPTYFVAHDTDLIPHDESHGHEAEPDRDFIAELEKTDVPAPRGAQRGWGGASAAPASPATPPGGPVVRRTEDTETTLTQSPDPQPTHTAERVVAPASSPSDLAADPTLIGEEIGDASSPTLGEPVTHFEDDVVVSPTLQQVSVAPSHGEPALTEHSPAPTGEPVTVEYLGEPTVSDDTGATGASRADTFAEEATPAEPDPETAHFEDDVVVPPTLQQVSVTRSEGEPTGPGDTGATGASRADTAAEEAPPAEPETSLIEVPTFEPSPVPTPAATGTATAAATPEPLVVSAFERRHNDAAGNENPGATDSARPRRVRPEAQTPTPMIDADARQAVRRTSAKSVTPGSEETGR